MKITFLGTGAADWPLERPEGMQEFRRLSSALIDDVLLIDPGPQVCEALQTYGKQPENIKYILNTHSHGDHYCPETVEALEKTGAVFVKPVCGEPLTLGKYTVHALHGNHATCPGTLHYLITDGEKTLFYGLDGAWLLYEEVQAIKALRPDFAVFDATVGEREGDFRIFEHNDLAMVLEMQKYLQQFIGTFCISHMARTLHTDHQTLCETMKPHNILVAYDGFETEI